MNKIERSAALIGWFSPNLDKYNNPLDLAQAIRTTKFLPKFTWEYNHEESYYSFTIANLRSQRDWDFLRLRFEVRVFHHEHKIIYDGKHYESKVRQQPFLLPPDLNESAGKVHVRGSLRVLLEHYRRTETDT